MLKFRKHHYSFGSPMPGRQLTSSAYRYGFNGKENDNEVVGTGQGTQDYGMRIYNPALGRFLSVDPLTKKFAWWTPYQFAGNSCISGIDLDGLEYLDYREVRIKIISGEIHVNLDNYNTTTRNAWIARDNATGGTSGNIGWPTKLGQITYSDGVKVPTDALSLDNDYSYIANQSQYSKWDKIEFGAPKRKDGNPDMRYKGNKLNQSEGGATSAPSGKYNNFAKGLSGAAAILNAGMWIFEQKQIFDKLEDQTKVEEHTSLLVKNVMQDMNVALKDGLIPPQYQNTKDLANIASVVLSGTNPTNNNDIYQIGMDIVKKISKNYRGTTTITTGDNGSSYTPSDNTSVNKNIVVPN
ncbi:MAG: hypothetical protein JNM51_10230 [Bacteroidia bacterium]|nr:hypothetical protein [Bacteroidia bacterium]